MARPQDKAKDELLPDGEEEEEEKEPRDWSGLFMMMGVSIGALLVVGMSVGITLYLVKDDTPMTVSLVPAQEDTKAEGEEDEEAEADKQAEAEEAEADKQAEAEEAEEEEVVRPDKPPLYKSLNPPFTVNFEVGGRIHFLQVSLQVMARDAKIIDAVTNHKPMLRNNILLKLSDLDYSRISVRAGRDEMRKQILEVVRESLKKETENFEVEEVYFTNFVMQ
ncbi:MAG TPA: flagellar basal body-associated FliL family protein [Acidiferrobacteraceae bacterium]|nr:flagellar basal body-associated FliL family protein [Acidiferrobacteraceae bacterium]